MVAEKKAKKCFNCGKECGWTVMKTTGGGSDARKIKEGVDEL
jgi:hypothetical protein